MTSEQYRRAMSYYMEWLNQGEIKCTCGAVEDLPRANVKLFDLCKKDCELEFVWRAVVADVKLGRKIRLG